MSTVFDRQPWSRTLRWTGPTVLLALALVCAGEAWLHRNIQWLSVVNRHTGTLESIHWSYPQRYLVDNNLTATSIHYEGTGLMAIAYDMAASLHGTGGRRVITDYPPDPYRILFPYIVSLFLRVIGHPTAVLLANLLIWVLASWSTYWIGRRVFRSRSVGFWAGLLTASGYAYIVLLNGPKAEMYQLLVPTVLIGLALGLRQFDNRITRSTLIDSAVVGLATGLGMFCGGATLYFLCFLFSYGVLTMRFRAFVARTAVLGVTALLLFFWIRSYIDQPPNMRIGLPDTLIFKNIWLFFRYYNLPRFFGVLTPWPIWIGAFLGLFGIRRRELLAIACMATTILASEAINFMYLGGHKIPNLINYYYLQFLLPLYLLNGRVLAALFGLHRVRVPVRAIARASAVALLAANILVANQGGLFHNFYYYYSGYRWQALPPMMDAYGDYDNQSVYRERFGDGGAGHADGHILPSGNNR